MVPAQYQAAPSAVPVELEPHEAPIETTMMGRSRRTQSQFSQPARLGPHMLLQAQKGYRAAVIELRPGLFIVAEVPNEMVRNQFGLAPLLTPLLVKAAKKALVPQRGAVQPQAAPAAAPAANRGGAMADMMKHGVQAYQAYLDHQAQMEAPGRLR